MFKTAGISFVRQPSGDATEPVADGAGRARPSRRFGRGQTLVEFTLVFPFFLMLLFSVVEFAFALNALLSIDFATREAALAAAEAGSAPTADCSILRAIEASVQPPADDRQLTQIRIFKSNATGEPVSPLRDMVYVRDEGASLGCPLPNDAAATLPYSFVSGTYKYDTRCNTLAGCGPGATTVDTIGVEATYVYRWHTPLPTLWPNAGSGYVMTKGNAMRMEPVQ